MTLQPGFAPHIARLGDGSRRVLALHCTLAFSGAWGGFVRALPGQLDVVAPDMPSHGQSPDWDGVSSFSDTTHNAALSAIEGPVDVIGHSFGGAIALRLAVEQPDLVRSLTLIEPVMFCVAAQDAPDSLVEHDDIVAPFYEAMQSGDMQTAARTFNRMWSEGPRWTDLPARLRSAMVRAIHVVPDTYAFLYDDSENLLPRLGAISAPSLVIHGETSLGVVKATNAGLAARLPDCEAAEIAGAGHMAPITHAKEVARVWSDFVAHKVV